jgi:hypothetical protein
MQKSYTTQNRSPAALIKASISFCLAISAFPTACLATNYDLSDGAQVQAGNAAGTGLGLNGATNKGNTNVQFQDFGWSADGFSPSSGDTSRPADLLPVNHQNTVSGTDGSQLNIYSYSSTQIKPNEYDGSTSGTRITQAPRLAPGQVNPYLPGTQTSLAPTSMGLQATHMLNTTLPITGPTKASGTSFGGIAPWGIYRGSYNLSSPTAGAFNPLQFSGANALPPASYGLLDFSTISK